ncbi:MAG: pilus assembly protein PilM [Chloroflexota bacterium]|nr:pilus assembly protein PilM [Chloroflexota bacterium]
MFDRERLTLSLEATELRLLVMHRQRVLHWDRLPLPAGVARNGQVVQPDAFGQAVAELLERVKGPRRNVVVSLNGQRSLVRILSLPAIPSKLLDEAVRREARRELPLPLEELYLSWHVIGDHSASRLQVFILGVPREALDNCVAGLRSAGVRPQAMDLKPLALIRAVNLPDVLLADLEAETETIILVRGFVPYIVRSVALPRVVATTPGLLGEARPPAERAEHLAVEIQRTLDFYGSTLAAKHPSWSPVVCLTGALGGAEEVRARVGAHWPLVEAVPPFPLPEELPLLPYLVNIGLALKDLP